MKRTPPTLRRLRTEQPNDAALNLDQKSSLEIAALINAPLQNLHGLLDARIEPCPRV